MNNIPELRKIIADAPDGATHYVNNEYCYRKETEEDFYLWANERWVLSSQVYFYTNSLSDLRTIVEQAERISELEAQLKELNATYFVCNCRPSELAKRDLEQQLKTADSFLNMAQVAGKFGRGAISEADAIRKRNKIFKELQQLKESYNELN